MTTEVLAPASARRSGDSQGVRDVAWVLGAVLLVVVAQAVSVVLPYVVNDLHRLPLDEVSSGLHDPKDLWPQGWAGGAAQLAGMLSWPLMVLGGLAGGTWAGARGPRAGRDGERRTARLAAVTVVVCVAALGYVSSPFGTALLAWRMD